MSTTFAGSCQALTFAEPLRAFFALLASVLVPSHMPVQLFIYVSFTSITDRQWPDCALSAYRYYHCRNVPRLGFRCSRYESGIIVS